jgi:hypothetical protein
MGYDLLGVGVWARSQALDQLSTERPHLKDSDLDDLCLSTKSHSLASQSSEIEKTRPAGQSRPNRCSISDDELLIKACTDKVIDSSKAPRTNPHRLRCTWKTARRSQGSGPIDKLIGKLQVAKQCALKNNWITLVVPTTYRYGTLKAWDR